MPLPRIFFVNRVYRPSTAATAQLLTDLAEGLAARGWPVHVVATGAEEGNPHGVTIHRTGAGGEHAGLFSRAANYLRFVRAARRKLAAHLAAGDLVVPMTDPPMLAAAVTRLAQERGAHVVPWIQDIYPEIAAVHLAGAASLAFRPLARWRDAGWRASACCVTLGEEMTRLVARATADGRCEVVPNWAPRELQVPATGADVAARRAAWGVADRFAVVYSGNLGRVHEFATVLDAAAKLRDRPDIVFLFIGTGARFAAVRAAVARHRLENVRLLPPEPRLRLAASLAAADAHLVTLRPEFAPLVFPSKLAGVLAAGRPVLFVGPTAGDIARLLARGPSGAAFAPGDGAGLATQIAAWQADAPQRARLGRQARALYEAEFTFAAALDRWDAILRGVGDGGSR